MTILSLPIERSVLTAAKPIPVARAVAEDELPPLWVLLALPLALVAIPCYLSVRKLAKALQRRS